MREKADKKIVSVLSCCADLKLLTRSAAKAAGGRLRRLGLRRSAPDWAARAAVCERCPLRVIHGGVSYCGTPFLKQIHRDITSEGCGCPTRAKAKDPAEHCPLNALHCASSPTGMACDCKWCQITCCVRHDV